MSVKKHSVLILDDEAVFRRTLKLHLTREGLAVFEAQNLSEARQVLAHQVCDLTLCDWKLDNESGLTLLEELKGGEQKAVASKSKPDIIFMSAHASCRNRTKVN